MNIKLRYFLTDAVFQTIPEVYENISFIQETELLRTHNHTYQFVTPEFNQAVLDDIEDLAGYKELVSEKFDNLELVIDDSSKVVAASLNDLNTRLLDLQTDYENVKLELYNTIEDNDLVYTSALNDLNSRIIALNEGLEEANNANDKLAQVIEDNELVIAEALNDLNSRTEVLEQNVVTIAEYNNTVINRNDSLINYTPQQLTEFLLAENGGLSWSMGTIPNTPRLDKSSENGSELVYTLGRNIYNTTTKVYRDFYTQYIIGFNGIYVRTGDTIGNTWNNAAPVTKVTNWGTSHTTAVLPANAKYVWGEVASLTITLADEVEGFVNHYYFQFDSGSTPTTLTLPASVKWSYDEPLEILANTRYQISIEDNIATVGFVSLT